MAFDIRSHPLLTAKVNALGPEAIDAWTRVAEHALGVADQEFGLLGTEDVEHALAITVNAFVEHDGRAIQAESKGSQSRTYAKVASGLSGIVPGLARGLVDSVLAAEQKAVRSGVGVTRHDFAF